MGGEWLQYNSGVHNEFDLFMTSKHNHLFQDNHSDEMDGLLEATTVVGNTDNANIVAVDHGNNDGETHNEKLQKDLSERLGMSAQQVKFWFQNKRTFSKGKMQRRETQNRWVENERLKTERQAIMLAMQNKTCLKCRGVMVQTQDTSEHQRLYTENMRLKEELLHATAYLKEGLRRNGMSLP
ncbi:Homeobox-leucine zipper protein ROC4 [Triticum urartu]|uniref:Homeobox-leucine zipper protein ROC4 n=1 Tax=Triticum urartu TaxID=4572 RepID=M7YPS8_TRIUA|nr:Homeobox-leucine zipper protein ROC4 [Triticum urartu]